ncbi:MAG TPA: hypothetical protein VNG93_13865 [Candidatus Dormibacteraeota bacterium]|nr:hypothetical protein [Candidatus Dormibacteraeota bacterium]
MALVRELDHRQAHHLRARGVTEEEIAAISLLGIGSDELNHLILNGVRPADQSTQLRPNP